MFESYKVITNMDFIDISSYCKGGLSGMVGIVISHPFDTIKTNIQSHNPLPNSFRQFYRGIIPPLLGVGLEKSIVFGTYTNMRKQYNTTISGAISGLVASTIVTPIERVKILLQNRKKIVFRGIYRGFSATLTREIPGFAIYFTVYERLYTGNLSTSFLCGALSGATSWLFIYPQDLVKTNMQSSNNLSYYGHVKKIYNANGLAGFYRGFHLALLRAMPLHGGTFFTMELLSSLT